VRSRGARRWRGRAAVALAAIVAGATPATGADAPATARFVGPRAGKAKADALARHGGDAATEKAVAAALDWLVRHQQDDGGWDADGFPQRCRADGKRCEGIGKGQHGEDVPCPFDAAISALATLALLGAGHGPWVEGDALGAATGRALERLRVGGDPWALALATQAFAEAEAMEGKGRFGEAARAGAATLLEARMPDGAWAYAGAFRRGADVPYSALVVEALVAARDVGAPLPATLAGDVDRWLDGLEADDGRLAYLADGRAYGYTPTSANALAAAAMREWLEVGRGGKRHRAHLVLAARRRPTWSIRFEEVTVPGRGKQRVQIGNLSLYEWWYGTMATFQAGGDAWTGWFARAKAALLPHQRTDGCAAGSFDPVGPYERQTGGRVFSTALGALILEAPYRHRRLSAP
jgi:hypothetical protein